MVKIPDPENQPEYGGEGIYANMNNHTGPNRLWVEPLYATSPSGALIESRNEFYNCHWGVFVRDYFQMRATRSFMISNQDVAAAPNKTFGFEAGSGLFDKYEINDNEIYNMESGIKMGSYPTYTVSVSPAYYPLGTIDVNKNQIHATVGWPGLLPPPTWQYVENGIYVEQTLLGAPGFSMPVLSYTHALSNNMTNVYRGIVMGGGNIFPAATRDNTITVKQDPAMFTNSFGIDHFVCYRSEIINNVVKGADPSAMGLSVSGIMAESSPRTHICSNTTDAMGRGFQFKGNSASTSWTDNTMANNLQGYVLNDALIGQQGDPGNAMNNEWLPVGYWTGPPLGPVANPTHTLVYGPTTPCYSPLFYEIGPTTEPTTHWGSPPTLRYSFISCSAPILNSATPGGFTCYPSLRPAASVAVAQQIAYASDNNARNWVMQAVLWNGLRFDSVLVDSSVALDSFRSRASMSRFAYLSNIETALAFGDTTLADTLLAATPTSLCSLGLAYDPTTNVRIMDDATVDYLVNNQKQFYRLWLHKLKGTWCPADAAQLNVIAAQCPTLYGPVVYRARMMHSLVHNVIKVWADTCGEDSSGYNMRMIPSKADVIIAQQQQYRLFPNPNDGNLTVMQMVADNGTVGIDVCDVVGRSIYKDNVKFKDNTYSLHLNNLTPGIYLMNIKDNKERLFNFKFVVQ